MREIIVSILRLSVVRFALTGVLNTVVGLGLIFALKWFYGWGDTTANLAGYGVGLLVSYVVNSRWSFGYRQALWSALPQYAAVVLLAYLVNLGCVHVAIDWLRFNSYLAQTLGVVPYTALTYILLRWWVFKPAPKTHVASSSI